MKRLVTGVLSIAAVAMTSLASVAGATPVTPPTPVPGMAYAVSGEYDTLYAIPPGGGSPVEVASLPGCYPWGATVVGDYVYWADNECGGLWRTSVFTGVSTEVIAPGFDGFYTAGYVTVDTAGNVWATGQGSMVAEIPAATLTPIVFSTTGGVFGAEELAPVAATQGYVYIEAGTLDSTIYRFADPTSGTPSSPIALQTYVTNSPGFPGAGMVADPNGNLYVADYPYVESGQSVYEISAVTQTSTLLAQTCAGYGIENLAYWSGNLYYSSYSVSNVCQFNSAMTSATVYSSGAFDPEGFGFYAGSGEARPPLLAVVSTDVAVPAPLSQTITATWNGVPGALSYTCTLMYGFGAPSSFTVTTPSRTCSFTGLSPTNEYGISVVANYGAVSSAPSVGFATPPPLPSSTSKPPPQKHSIVCKKNRGTALRVVTAVHPRCPSGWHRVG
jgi:hypothetical protein